MNKSRMEAFSDGVFAIVITLLVLEIHLPEGLTIEKLPDALLGLLPTIAAYVLSFFIIGLYWVAHHRQMHVIKTVTNPMLWLNLIWLLFISVMAFSTSLIGTFPLQAIPVAIYGANLTLANITGFFAVLYVYRHPEVAHQAITKEDFKRIIPRYVVPNSLYLTAIVFGWIEPVVSYIIYAAVLLWLIYQYSLNRRLSE